jgi:hypothetical protein
MRRYSGGVRKIGIHEVDIVTVAIATAYPVAA